MWNEAQRTSYKRYYLPTREIIMLGLMDKTNKK